MLRRDLLKAVPPALASLAGAQEPRPVLSDPERERINAELLSGYDYPKYVESLTGYTGQDRQRIAVYEYRPALRTRVGPRGNYKAGIAQLPGGELVVAACRHNGEKDPEKTDFDIHVYRSSNRGRTWSEIGQTPLHGKEPSLTVLADGTLVMTAQKANFGAKIQIKEIPISRSTDGGKTWQTSMLPGDDYPHNLIVEPDRSLTLVRALEPSWWGKEPGSPRMQICRSADGGRTWKCEIGIIDWDYRAFGEVSCVHLRDGRYLAALRRQIPGTVGEGFEETVLTESRDDGRHWSAPRRMTNTAEVHVHLLELRGKLLATYSSYHLPWGVYAMTSSDQGRTWDQRHPVELALSAGFNVGWGATIEYGDGLATVYGATTYLNQPENTTCEVVFWNL